MVQAFLATMLVTVLSDNLGILWIAMEGTTITSAILVGFHGQRQSFEAAWKYIIVTTIGISFGLFGTVLVYGAAVHEQGGVFTGAMNWSTIATIAHRLDPSIVRIGFIFVVVGYGTKAGLAPVHMWLPDAHSQAPTPVSALLSGALLKCALLGIIRFFTIARAACRAQWCEGVLLTFGLMSVVVATPFILAQHALKRLLGYHSVEHVGIITLGLGFGGRIGTYGALLHVINHGVTKALAFLVAGDALARYGSRDMRRMKGYLAIAPWAGTFLLMAAFSLAGTPPFSIFVSELLVIRAGLSSGRYLIVTVMLVMFVVIFAGLIHHVGQMVFGTPEAAADGGKEAAWPVFAMVLLAGVMVLLGVSLPRKCPTPYRPGEPVSARSNRHAELPCIGCAATELAGSVATICAPRATRTGLPWRLLVRPRSFPTFPSSTRASSSAIRARIDDGGTMRSMQPRSLLTC